MSDYLRRNWKTVWWFLIYCFIFGVVTTPFLVLFGPFHNVKRSIVSSALESMHYQFIARSFLTESAMARIVKWQEKTQSETVPPIEIDPGAFNDQIDVVDVSGPGYVGKAVIIHDPTRVAVGYSEFMPKSGQTTSKIAQRNDAVVAINGGGFVDTSRYTGNGGEPDGFVVSKGEIKFNNIDADAAVSVAAIDSAGKLIVGRYSLNQLMQMQVREAINFGPALLINGVKQDPVFYGTAPRTAIGQMQNGEIIFVVTEGRRLNKPGATNTQIQDLMLNLGAVNAVNLDGGSSSTLYFVDPYTKTGGLLTRVSDGMGERSVPTAFMVLPKSWRTGK